MELIIKPSQFSYWLLLSQYFRHYTLLFSSSVFYWSQEILKKILCGCPCGVMVKAMDNGIVVSEFVLQSPYYVHFQADTLGKGMHSLILPAMD